MKQIADKIMSWHYQIKTILFDYGWYFCDQNSHSTYPSGLQRTNTSHFLCLKCFRRNWTKKWCYLLRKYCHCSWIKSLCFFRHLAPDAPLKNSRNKKQFLASLPWKATKISVFSDAKLLSQGFRNFLWQKDKHIAGLTSWAEFFQQSLSRSNKKF